MRMKYLMLGFAAISAILLISTLLHGCDGKSTKSAPTVPLTIAIAPSNPSIPYGTSIQFKAEKTLDNGSKQDVTSQVHWLSSDSTVTITSGGLAKSTAKGATSATISVSLNGEIGQTTLTVKNVDLLSISVTPAYQFTAPTAHLQFTATGAFSDASTQYLTDIVDWSSGDTNIITIDNQGLARGVNFGQTTIEALSTFPLTSVSGQAIAYVGHLN